MVFLATAMWTLLFICGNGKICAIFWVAYFKKFYGAQAANPAGHDCGNEGARRSEGFGSALAESGDFEI